MNNKIIIVEDELISASYLKEFLEIKKFNVIDIVDNAKDAFNSIKVKKPDIVLLDIVLKGAKTGAELALEISNLDRNIIIIFISAYSTEEMLDYAINSNASGYLLKPYREKEVISTIKLALAKNKNTYTNSTINKYEISLEKGFVYDTKTKTLFQYNVQIPLSKKATLLIDLLVQNKNNILPNNFILNKIWDKNSNINTLRSLVHRIKIQLNEHLIINSNGNGYMIKSS